MTKKLSEDEIDLLDFLIVVWKKKWIVFSFTIITIGLMYFYQSYFANKNQIIKYSVKSEIRPITVFDEAKYKIYNSFVRSVKPYSFSLDKLKLQHQDNYIEDNKSFVEVNNMGLPTALNELEVSDIDKDFLFNLFVDQINQKTSLAEYIKKSKIIKKEDFKDQSKFEDEVLKIANSVNLFKPKDKNLDQTNKSIIIEHTTINPKKWEEFLQFLEKEVNIEIQKKLNLMFDDYIQYVETIVNFQMEDIENQYSITIDEDQKNILERKKNLLESDKYIERMQNIFASSPISESNDFYAARIIYDSTKSLFTKKSSTLRLLILAGLIGAIFGIFFALISNAIQSRRQI